MQHGPTADKKRKIDPADPGISTETVQPIPTFDLPQENLMFLQIIDEYPSNYLVKIDPIEDTIIYEDLLEFEKSKITIQMNNYDPESLYTLYEGNVCRPERYNAWSNFLRNVSFRKIPEKSEYILLDHENLHKIQKARWFVTHFAL